MVAYSSFPECSIPMFIDTLPLIFKYSQLIGPVELLIVSGFLLGILYVSAPFPDDSLKIDGSKLDFYNYLYRIWQGEIALITLFWPFFLLLNGALYAADTLAKSAIISVSSWGNIHMILLGPLIWWTVAVWRGSTRTGLRWWSACARLAVISAYFELGLRLYIRTQHSRLFFNCEELLMDYFSCF